MDRSAAAPTTTRRTLRPTTIAVVVVCAAIVGILVSQSASSSALSFSEAHAPGDHRAVPLSPSSSAPSSADVPRRDHGGATTEVDGVTEDDGVLPDHVTVFDDGYPGVANLDPELLQALREAATDAADDGIELYVNSGWRSPAYQDQLLREAVTRYGSERKAARWVATVDTSAHVTGDAVDIGAVDATSWLSRNGARYGLCQIYRNESWHYELRPNAIDHGCPPAYADPAHDPSMR